MRDNSKAIDVFVHVPRTAGSYLREFIGRHRHVLTWSGGEMLPHLNALAGEFMLWSHHAMGIEPFVGSCRYFTILSEPLTLAISEWRFHATECNPLRKTAEMAGPVEFTTRFRADNQMVRMFAGWMGYWHRGAVDGNTLAAAVEALRGFAFVGRSDQLDTSAAHLLQLLGIDDAIEVKQRESSPEQLSSDERDVILSHNRWDARLWEMFTEGGI
jgi:hypothetical protein